MPVEMTAEIDKDMRDTLFMDAIEDKVIHFTNSQKEQLEEIIDLMSSGQLIEITQPE